MKALLKTFFLLLITTFFCIASLNARHIIGGEVTYECLGNGQYRFVMKVYRDDACTNCADFDELAFVAIYRGNTAPYELITKLDVPIDRQGNVTNPDYDCLDEPDNIIVQEASYTFSTSASGFTLPAGDESYHVVYQRCCRNETINNIVNPDDSGASYSVEITPAGQLACNSSPVFRDFPPTIICVDEPLIFNHSATDADGDQLVYSFCAPLLGGGNIGTNENPGNPAACTGIRPDPPCEPPFNAVRYVFPTYSAEAPLAGNPVVTISANKGVIVGTPTTLGQFVVGVCVEEYRNGELLGSIRRDFQFNVVSCTPVVEAGIQADVQIGEKQYLLNSCGENTITFINESIERRNINNFFWEFNIDNQIETVTTWDATYTFPEIGTYEGRIILNPGTACGDTANIFVNIFPDIAADFEFEYDTCNFGPVDFSDLSSSGAGPITEWRWSFGDGATDQVPNPRHSYRQPNSWPVTLSVTDENSCVGDTTKFVDYFPLPPLIILEPSDFSGCIPLATEFKLRAEPFEIDDNYDVFWDLGDGTTSTEVSPLKLYETPGLYDISVEVTTPFGCFASGSFPDWVDADPSPQAEFTFTPKEPSNFNSTVTFIDQSIGAASWNWDFGGLGSSIQRDPVFNFRDTGQQVVRLVVTHPSGCQDTVEHVLDIEPQVRYFLPNAFTPNNDDINDVFQGEGIFSGMVDFRFSIWNRWGELIFETTDPTEGWNGRKDNTGMMSPNGVYVVIVQFRDPRGNFTELRGFASLVK